MTFYEAFNYWMKENFPQLHSDFSSSFAVHYEMSYKTLLPDGRISGCCSFRVAGFRIPQRLIILWTILPEYSARGILDVVKIEDPTSFDKLHAHITAELKRVSEYAKERKLVPV